MARAIQILIKLSAGEISAVQVSFASGLLSSEDSFLTLSLGFIPIMLRRLKKSCNKATGKKATQFKRGIRSTLSQTSSATSHSPGNQSPESSDSQPMVRLTVQEASDLLSIRANNTYGADKTTGLPYKLRPRPEKQENIRENECNDENFIINIGKMSQLIGHMHGIVCKQPKISTTITKRIGLCIYVSLECANCGYKSPSMPMSETTKPPRGPPAGALNDMLILSVLKSKIGIDDASNLLTCLNIRTPCKTTLQRKMNRMAENAVHVNEKQMLENQKYVARVMSLAGENESADLQFDVAYTCRPQGGCEKAAQSFGALIEHTTTRKLPVAIATANKHCKKKGCKHLDCTKNFPSDASIASSERILLHQSLDTVDRAGHLKIGSITTDAGTQTSKAIRDYYNDRSRPAPPHYKCLVHKLRALIKHLRQLNLKSIPKGQDKVAYLRKLATSIRGRVRLELINANKQSRDINDFIRLARPAIDNITKCFSGNHRLCPELSKVCPNTVHQKYSHLPYGTPLKLSGEDLEAVKLKISNLFSENGLREVARLYSTNMCESLNSAVFHYAPKAGCWTRNFTALCHSATHSRTLGPGQSTLYLAKAAGLSIKRSSVMFKILTAKDRIRRYHRLRRASAKYKQARHYYRKRKMNRTLFTESLYSSENASSSSAADHNYGLSH